MFIFEQIRVGGTSNFGYLIGDRDAGQAVLIDPSFRPKKLVQRARDQRLTVTHVINTHGHRDHTIGNSRALKLTGARLVAHRAAGSRPEVAVDHGDELALGSLTLRFLYTPGHADDHLCVLVDEVCLTGDILFVGKIGGTATAAAARVEHDSLHRVLLELPDATTIWPGHDFGCRPSSTIGLEKRTNPFLLCDDFESFLQLKAEWPEYKRRLGLT